ncbi:MAG: hypothetical protein EXR52_03345 [Dehalococcoidia bacterium]|nr:hypothetical protein [Dehalococcoidia bacterium]
MHTRRFLLTSTLVLGVTVLAGASTWWLQHQAAATVDAGSRTITVMGQDEVLARPDMANAYLGVGVGVTVTTVHAIAEHGVAVPGPFPVKAPDQAAPATPIQPGTQTVTGNVTAALIIG